MRRQKIPKVTFTYSDRIRSSLAELPRCLSPTNGCIVIPRSNSCETNLNISKTNNSKKLCNTFKIISGIKLGDNNIQDDLINEPTNINENAIGMPSIKDDKKTGSIPSGDNCNSQFSTEESQRFIFSGPSTTFITEDNYTQEVDNTTSVKPGKQECAQTVSQSKETESNNFDGHKNQMAPIRQSSLARSRCQPQVVLIPEQPLLYTFKANPHHASEIPWSSKRQKPGYFFIPQESRQTSINRDNIRESNKFYHGLPSPCKSTTMNIPFQGSYETAISSQETVNGMILNQNCLQIQKIMTASIFHGQGFYTTSRIRGSGVSIASYYGTSQIRGSETSSASYYVPSQIKGPKIASASTYGQQSIVTQYRNRQHQGISSKIPISPRIQISYNSPSMMKEPQINRFDSCPTDLMNNYNVPIPEQNEVKYEQLGLFQNGLRSKESSYGYVCEKQENKPTEENYIFGSKYRVKMKDELGRGRNIVYLGQNIKTDEEVAIKILVPSQDNQKALLKEFQRQQDARSPGVVQVYDHFVTMIEGRRKIVAVFELMDGCLEIDKNGYPPDIALKKIQSLLLCYSQLYKKKITHRDLKPQNILLHRKKMKISDFGSAHRQDEALPKISQFTRGYCSPQQARNKVDEITDKCDVYAIGCIFFQLLIGKNPLEASCTTKYNRIDKKKFKNILQQRGIPEDMIGFLEGCLREKQTVLVADGEGSYIEDQEKSRFSWQDVYTHKIFKGELSHIAKQIGGASIYTNIRKFAEDKINIFRLLESVQSNYITIQQFAKNLRDNEIYISMKDVQKLRKIFGGTDKILVKELVSQLQKVDLDQTSSYSNKQILNFMEPYLKNIQCYKNCSLENIVYGFIRQVKRSEPINLTTLDLSALKLTSFPLLPKFKALKYLMINDSPIEVVNARLNAPNLKNLQLARCQIQRIVTIRGCPQLQVLNLNRNKLRAIEGLQMLLDLTQLYMVDNRLSQIANLYHLKKLKKVQLQTNRIKSINALTGCKSLEILGLDNNRIEKLGSHFGQLALLPLKEIHLMKNKISGNHQDQQQLQIFKRARPKCYVFLSDRGQYFRASYTQTKIEDGSYLIFSKNDPTRGMVAKGRYIEYSLVNSQSSQGWTLTNLKDNEVSIMSSQGKILDFYLQLEDNTYDREQSSDCRWSFEKKGQDQNGQYYIIRNMKYKHKIILQKNGIIRLWKKEVENEQDLWYVQEIE